MIGSHVSSVEFCQVVRRPRVFSQCVVSVLSQFCKNKRYLDVVPVTLASEVVTPPPERCAWQSRSAPWRVGGLAKHRSPGLPTLCNRPHHPPSRREPRVAAWPAQLELSDQTLKNPLVSHAPRTRPDSSDPLYPDRRLPLPWTRRKPSGIWRLSRRRGAAPANHAQNGVPESLPFPQKPQSASPLPSCAVSAA